MADELSIKPIARIRNDFGQKFGVPRQAGLAGDMESLVIFEPEFSFEDALRGIEGFSYIWLIWGFSESIGRGWSPTVRPPRLGGNRRMGVFATRSPFRPNPIGLSSVKLHSVLRLPGGELALKVLGADMMDNTPIYDIKPYVPYADCHPEASGGFTDDVPKREVEVSFPEELLSRVPEEKRASLVSVLSCDPRPSYQNDPERVYGMAFGGMDIRFMVRDGILTVVEVEKI